MAESADLFLAKSAGNFSVPVQAADEDLEMNSKPRTVSLEEGGDDAAQIPYANITHVPVTSYVLEEHMCMRVFTQSLVGMFHRKSIVSYVRQGS